MGYPIVLDLKGRQITVVGGGEVATRKVARLLEEGASIRVISPAVTRELRQWAEEGRLELHVRPYEPQDLDNSELLFVATDDARLNARVAEEARSKRLWCNVADGSVPGDFILPAIVSLPPLQLAIDTGGGGPALSRALREHLEATLAPGWARGAALFTELRPLIRGKGSAGERQRFWRLLAAALPEAAMGSEKTLTEWIARSATTCGLELDRASLERAIRLALEIH